MGFTHTRCQESGVWRARCHHAEVVVEKGERFPECAECRRGVEWHRVGSARPSRGGDPRAIYDDWSEGWWPGKAD